MEVSAQLQASAALHMDKEPPGRTYSRSGHDGEEEKLYSCRESNPDSPVV
jgi:hypothetical protein